MTKYFLLPASNFQLIIKCLKEVSSMAGNGYQDLIVWQKSMDLVTEIYRLLLQLPAYENYALANQMRRAAVSIPSNIAEGQSRKSKKEFLQFLAIAQGSKAELQTQLLICNRLGYTTLPETEKAMQLCEEIGSMIYVLMTNLKRKT